MSIPWMGAPTMIQGPVQMERMSMPLRAFRFWMLFLTCGLLSGCNAGCDTGLQPGTFNPVAIAFVTVPGKNLMELTSDGLTFVDSRKVEWVAPKGTWTDGASVPRLALFITDGRFQEEFLKAAIVHDAYCQEFNKARCKDQFQKRPWRDVHRMFYEACLAGKTSSLKAKLMFAGVWWGGPRWDDPQSHLQSVDDEVLQIGYRSCERFIEGNDPSVQEIESWMDRREPIIVEVAKQQSKFMEALNSQDQATAEVALDRSEKELNRALAAMPNDLMVLNLKGYHHKNVAISYRQADLAEKVDGEIAKAEKTFLQVMQLEPKDASALNGLGSVAIMRNQLDRAEGFIRQALEVEPDYPAAQYDLKLIDRIRKAESAK